MRKKIPQKKAANIANRRFFFVILMLQAGLPVHALLQMLQSRPDYETVIWPLLNAVRYNRFTEQESYSILRDMLQDDPMLQCELDQYIQGANPMSVSPLYETSHRPEIESDFEQREDPRDEGSEESFHSFLVHDQEESGCGGMTLVSGDRMLKEWNRSFECIDRRVSLEEDSV